MTEPVDALAEWLAGDGDPPPELATLLQNPQPELWILQRLCRGHRTRAAIAARALAHLLPATAPARVPAPAPAPTPAFPIAHWHAALQESQADVARVMALEDEVARLSPWLGIGWHRDGSALVDVVHDRLDDLTRLLDRLPELQRIAKTLGRLDAAERAGRGQERGGRETVVGVKVGGELSDVLPSELVMLADAATEDIFYARLTERQLLSLEMSGELLGSVKTERRPGPVIACIDTSGSMIGLAEEAAKAATLAVLRRALGEGRRARVILFGGRDAQREVDFRPTHADARALFDVLMSSFRGGTDFDQPLARALAIRAEPAFAKADVLLVTDGVAKLKKATVRALQDARGEGMRLVLALIGSRPSLVGDIADEVLRVELDSLAETA